MHANVGRWDGWIRGALAIVCLLAAGAFVDRLLVSLSAALGALLLAATALTHSCPFYHMLGIDTRHRVSAPRVSHR